MLAFGLNKKLCNDFLKKQAVIGNLDEGECRPGRQGWGMLFRQEKPLCVYLHISAHFSTWLVMFVVEN